MEQLKIEYLAVESLKPYEKNARKHGEKSIEGIKASIKEFGMNDPIGIWGKQNLIVEGHGRLQACKELGIKTVPCIRLDNLTEEQRKAYALAHNKTAELSDWDIDLLNAEIEEIEFIEMEQFGFEKELSPDDLGEEFELPDGDKSEICQMTFTLHNEQAELIKYAMGLVKNDVVETFGNTNSNGNALYEVVRQWAEQRK